MRVHRVTELVLRLKPGNLRDLTRITRLTRQLLNNSLGFPGH